MPKHKELQLLRRIVEIANSDLDLNIVLHNIIALVVELTKADSCFLYILDKKNNELVLSASSNPHPRILRKIKLKLGEGLTGWVAEKKEIVVIPQKASEDPRFKMFNSLPEDKYESFVGIPILLRDEVVGVINFQHKNRKRYSKDLLSTLSMVAQLVSGVVKHAWLYEEMRNKSLHLESIFRISKAIITANSLDEILQLIVEVVAEVMSSPICSIMLLNKKKSVLEIKATQSLSEAYRRKPPIKVGEGISGQAFLEKRPIMVKNVIQHPEYQMKEIAKKEKLKAMLSVPMVFRNSPIGVINVYSSQEKDFSKDEVVWLQVIADQAAIAIENARLEQDSRAVREALEARKLIERAKGILMKELNISEEAAYRLIHKKSMDSCRPMKEIAQAIILSREVTGS